MLAAREMELVDELEVSAGEGKAARSAETVVLLLAAKICCSISGDSITGAASDTRLTVDSEASELSLSSHA